MQYINTIDPTLREGIFTYMQIIMTYSFLDYFTYSITILVFSIIFLVFPKGPILGLPVWGDGNENEEMDQTDPQYHLHIVIQAELERSSGDISEKHAKFSLEKVKFNIWDATNFLWEGSRILQCVFKCKQDFLQIDATFLDKSVYK